MMANEERYAEWLAGVKHLVYKEKVLRQTEMASKVGVQKEHINAVMRERRAAGDVLQDNISAALGFSYDSIRTLGQLILGGANADDALKAVRAGTIATGHVSMPAPKASGEAEAVPAFGESVTHWLAGKSAYERYETVKAGLVSLGTPPGEVARVLAGAIELPLELLQGLPQDKGERFDAIWAYVCGADQSMASSWQTRYRADYIKGDKTDSEVYVAAHEWLSAQKKG